MKVKLRYLFLVLAILGASCPFYGQTVGFHRLGQVLARAPQGVMAQVVPYAKINVTNSATRLAATIYSDVNLTVPISPPLLTADANGQYDYFVPANYCVNESISSPSQGNQTISNICQGTTFSQAAGLPFQAQYNNNGVLGGSLATLDASGNANFNSATFAGGPYLDITNPVFGGICDGLTHVVGGVDLNVQAVQRAFSVWQVGGWILGNPTGANCVFTQQVAFTATAAVGNVTTPFEIDTRGGVWHSQVTATPVARFWSNTGGGDYSVCPTGLTVNGDASIPVTVTCGQQAATGSANLAPAFAAPPNYTVSNWTEAAGTMSINFTGANSFSPTTPLTISAATGYCVTITTYTASSGTLTVTLGGTTSSAVTPKAGATNIVCLTTVDTTNLTIQASTGGANVVLSSVVVQPMDLQVSKISMTTPNTGSAFSGHPTVVMTGGNLYPGGSPAGVIAILSGDFNFTVGKPNPPSGSLTIGGFKIEDSNFTDDGFGSAVLFNLESGAFDRATLGHVSLIHSTFRTTTETATAFQGTGTFESLASNNRFIYSNSATGATAASAGYYGFALMVSQVGPASSEWEIDRNRSAGFDHGFYVNGGAMTVSNNQPLLSWEEGIWASSSRATISGNHTENTWSNNPTGRTDRAAIFCQGNCTFVNDDDFIGTTVGQNNFAIRTFVPSNNQGVIVGGASLNEGQYGYTFAELAGAPGQNIAVWGIPRLNGAATSDYVIASGGLTVTDSATLYNTGQSVGAMQWLQMGNPPNAGGFYAIGPSNSSTNYAETYRAVRTTPGAFLVTGDYTDASGVRHDQHCTNFTGVTPPLLGTPTGCADNRSFTPGGNSFDLSGVGIQAGKTYTIQPQGGQLAVGPASTTSGEIPNFSGTLGSMTGTPYGASNKIPSTFLPSNTYSVTIPSWCPGVIGTLNATTYFLQPGSASGTCTTTQVAMQPIPILGTILSCYVNVGTAGAAAGSGVVDFVHGVWNGTSFTNTVTNICTMGTAKTCSKTGMSIPIGTGTGGFPDGYYMQVTTGQANDTTANVRVSCQLQAAIPQ